MKHLVFFISLVVLAHAAAPSPREAIQRKIYSTGISPAPAIESPLNVQWFGARGDGVTNDTAAIQAALDAVPTNGGTVLIPMGTYLVSGLLVRRDGTVIRGLDRPVLQATTAEIRVVSSNDYDRVTVCGLRIVGTGADTGSSSGRGAISFTSLSENCRAYDNEIINASGSAVVDDGNYNQVFSNFIDTTGEHGIYISGPTGSVCYGNVINNAGQITVLVPASGVFGIKIDGAVRCVVSANTIKNAKGIAIQFAGTTLQNSVCNNTIDHAGLDSALVLSGGTCTENIVCDNTVSMGTAGKSAIELTKATRCIVSNNLVSCTADSYGILVGDVSTKNQINSNTVIANAAITSVAINFPGTTDNICVGNQIVAGSGTWATGIGTNSSANRNRLLNNLVQATTKYSQDSRDTVIEDPDYVGKVQTTDATPTQIYRQVLTGTGAYVFTFHIVGSEAAGANRAAYVRETLAYGNTCTIQGTTSVATIESDAAWDVTIDGDGDAVRVRVTGAVATTINWRINTTFVRIEP